MGARTIIVVFHCSVLAWSYTSAPSKAAMQASVAISARRVVGIGYRQTKLADSSVYSVYSVGVRIAAVALQESCRSRRCAYGVGRGGHGSGSK